MTNLVKILCVDDEPRILEGLRLHLRRGYDLVTAGSGEEGLVALAERGPFAVVMSDMRMPGMDGATFLEKVRHLDPDATRMLLTGHSELEAAVAAVNRGQIFRFLTKPIPPDELRRAFEAAAEQHRLVTAERVLLEQTLRGAIKALTDVLALASPLAFGRATRVRDLVTELAGHLDLVDVWVVEVAAMLSQLGLVAVPDAVLVRHMEGAALSAGEQAMIDRAPKLTQALVSSIPRLDAVWRLLAAATKPLATGDRAATADGARAASVLRIALDYDALAATDLPEAGVLDALRRRGGAYDEAVLAAFVSLRSASAGGLVPCEVELRQLTAGMVFADDVHTSAGVLLAARGCAVTPTFIERARNFQAGFVKEPVRVLVER